MFNIIKRVKKRVVENNVKLEKIVGGGQAIGILGSGKKVFVWGGLPGEVVEIEITKSKSSHAEAVVTGVVNNSDERIVPTDIDSYLSTSPWQIMSFKAEQRFKSTLVQEAFELHGIDINKPNVASDSHIFNYRNKMEYSFWWDEKTDSVSLAFFKRGSHHKQPVSGSSLPMKCISNAAELVLKLVNKRKIDSRTLKTLVVRCNQKNDVVAQLYVRDEDFPVIDTGEFESLGLQGFEIIYSNPKSPASVITTRLQHFGKTALEDSILGNSYTYSPEGFFQVNIPMYEMTLGKMKAWIDPTLPTVDMYCGVGTIGLSIGSNNLTLVESNEFAVKELQNNLSNSGGHNKVSIMHTESEKALNAITSEINLILDPPRAGCHDRLIERINSEEPRNIIYLSCNPVTQARDISVLTKNYNIAEIQTYNFFPRTPHIENLVILNRK